MFRIFEFEVIWISILRLMYWFLKVDIYGFRKLHIYFKQVLKIGQKFSYKEG